MHVVIVAMWVCCFVLGIFIGKFLNLYKKGCFGPFNHDWTEWVVIEKGDQMLRKHSTGEKWPIGNYEVQRRECMSCKKSQIRKVVVW